MIMGSPCGFPPPTCLYGCLAAQPWVDRKIARRCVASTIEAGQARDGGVAQLASIIGAATDPVHQLDTTLTPTKCS